MTTPTRAAGVEVPAHVREANRLAALRDVENAPPASAWTPEQVAVLAELFGPRRARASDAA